MIEDLYTVTAAIQGKVRTPDDYGGWTEVWADLIASLPGHFYALSGAERDRYAKKELFASYAFMHAPFTVGGSLQEYNDQADQLSGWSFIGLAKGINTDAEGKLYIELTDTAGTRKVSVYKDAAKANLVAEGTRVGNGVINLLEKNASGLTGSVTVAYTVNDIDIYLQYPFAIGGTVREYNDAGNQLSAWSFSGLDKGTNTDVSGKLYVKLVDAAGTRTVGIYKDSALGGGDLVAEGSRAGDGAIVLLEQNLSGLTGAVTAAYTANDSDIFLQYPFRISEDDRFVLEGKSYDIVFVNTSIPFAKYLKLLLEDIE